MFFIRHLIRLIIIIILILICCALSNAASLPLYLSPSPADNCAKGKTGRGMQNVIGAGAAEEEKEVEDNSSRLYAPIVQARILRSRLE